MSRRGPDVKAIFTAALDHPAGPERENYLADACGDDDGLRRRVEELLAAHAQASDVLGPAGAPAAATEANDVTREFAPERVTDPDATVAASPQTETDETLDHGPSRLLHESETTTLPGVPDIGPGDGNDLSGGATVRYFGDYEIKSELGRGGMGVVYEARQVSLNRPVALKMVKAGLLAGDDELRRFKNEAEAVALLDHPGIVPVYEVGEHDGQHYFSMKLVPGGRLGPRLDRYKDDPKAAARLTAEAAEAVAHAHARGILHRDLKPANILVDAEGHPRVTDFGLAKRVEGDVELTQSGAILGTPAYMSPEQASGRRGAVTTASDVYGLGAVLYALLTSRAPFGGESVVETIDAVRQRPPEPPRNLNAAVPRHLETICLKCLEKDPRRRYPTAQALADDLSAWLESRPIAAQRVGTAERAWLWCKRRPAVARLSAATVLVSLAGLAFGAWQWSAALRNARIADANADVARVKSLQARTSARVACNGVDDLMTNVAAVDLADIPQMAPVRMLLLDKAREAYERLQRENANRDDAELLWVSARAQGRLGDIQAMLGQFRDAEASYRGAISRLESLAEDHPAGSRPGGDTFTGGLGWDILRDLVRNRLGLSVLLKDLYRLDEASDQFRRAAACGQPLKASGDASDGGLLAEVDYQQGVLLAREVELSGSLPSPDSPEFRASKEAYQRAIGVQEKLAEDARSRVDAGRYLVQQRAKLARFRNNLGKLLEAAGRYVEAEGEFRQVLDLIPDSERAPGSRWQRARGAHNLGAHWVGRAAGATGPDRKALVEQAVTSMLTAKNLFEGLLNEFPEVPQYREELAEVSTNLGDIRRRSDQKNQAMDDLRRAEALSDRLVAESPTVPKYHLQSARVCRLMAEMLAEKDWAASEANARKSVERLASLQPLYPVMPHDLGAALGRAYWRLSRALAGRGQIDAAREVAERAVVYHQAARRSNPGSTRFRSYLWDSHFLLALIRLKVGDIAGAAKDAEELPRVQPDTDESYVQAAVFLIECAGASGDRQVHYYDRAMNVLARGVDRQVFDRKRLDHPALNPLRDREDFRRLQRPPTSAAAG